MKKSLEKFTGCQECISELNIQEIDKVLGGTNDFLIQNFVENSKFLTMTPYKSGKKLVPTAGIELATY